MNSFAFDASALAKRYSLETGADRVDYLFEQIQRERLMGLMLGVAEVISVLVRRRNGGVLSQAAFAQGMSNLKAELLDDDDFTTLPADNNVVAAALPLIDKHSLNATDAVVLRVFLDVAALLRSEGNDLLCCWPPINACSEQPRRRDLSPLTRKRSLSLNLRRWPGREQRWWLPF